MYVNAQLQWINVALIVANLAQYGIFTNNFHKYDLLASFIGIQEEMWTMLGMYEAN